MAVTGLIGDAEVRLENAAEEATMQKILDTLRDMEGIGTGVGAGATAGIFGAAGTMGKLGKSVNLANIAFKGLGGAIGFATGAMSRVISLGSGAVKMGAGFAATQPKITDFSSALGDLPGPLGALGEAVHAVVELLYKNYTTFQSLSASGIAFGDRLESMNLMAGRLGIGLDQLSGTLVTNVERLARLGTGTRGATMAIEDAATAFDLNSESLLRFGLSFEEQNETFMRFFALNSLALQNETVTRRQLIDMSDDYAKGLRRLSELTGVSADQLQDEVDKANMNKAFDAYMSGLDGAEKARMESILKTFGTFGDAGREAAMAMIMGVAPLTEGSAQLMSINGRFANTLRTSVGNARSFNGSLESFEDGLRSNMIMFANNEQDFVRNNSKFFASLALAGDGLGVIGGEFIAGVNRFRGGLEDTESNMGRTSPLAQAFANLESLLQSLREKFLEAFTTVLTDQNFQDGMTKFGNFISDVTSDIEQEGFFNYVKRIFNELMDKMYSVFVDSFLVRNILGIDKSDVVQSYNTSDVSALNERQIRQIAEVASSETNYGIQGRQAMYMAGFRPDGLTADELATTKGGAANQSFMQMLRDIQADPSSATQSQLDMMSRFIELQQMENKAFRDEFNAMVEHNSRFGNPQMYNGTPGAFGSLFHDFGTGTTVDLHGRESVLNQQQMNNLVNGVTAMASQSPSIDVNPNVGNGIQTVERSLANISTKMVDSNRDSSVKLLDAISILTRKMEMQNNLTRQVISQIEMNA